MNERDKYVAKFKSQLDVWNAEINELETKAKGMRDEVRQEGEQLVASLRQHRDEAREKLAEMQHVGADAFHDVKEGLDKTWSTLKDAIDSTVSRFRQ